MTMLSIQEYQGYWANHDVWSNPIWRIWKKCCKQRTVSSQTLGSMLAQSDKDTMSKTNEIGVCWDIEKIVRSLIRGAERPLDSVLTEEGHDLKGWLGWVAQTRSRDFLQRFIVDSWVRKVWSGLEQCPRNKCQIKGNPAFVDGFFTQCVRVEDGEWNDSGCLTGKMQGCICHCLWC